MTATAPTEPHPNNSGATTDAAPADHRTRADPHRWAPAAVVVGALVTDVAWWTRGPGLAWTVAATVVALAVLIGARPRRPAPIALLTAVPVLAVWCSLRTSPWLIGADLVAVNVCLLLGADLGGRGRWTDQSLARVVVRLVAAPLDAVWAMPWLRRAWRQPDAPPSHRDRTSLVVGAAIALPLAGVLTALLASADAVFASFLDVGVGAGSVVRHVAALLVGALAIATLLRLASASTDPDLPPPPLATATVGNIVLGAVALVFAGFAASRVLAMTGSAERIASTQGLTWAEYARSGFFELLMVAAITLGVLVTVCGWCQRGTATQVRRRKVLGVVIVVETIGIVVDAVQRLDGYADAYGLTMLRLASTGFAWWLGVVFVIAGVAVVTDYRGARWLTPTIVTSALVALFVANLINPEALVASRNLDATPSTVEPDTRYLMADLGDDALVAIDRRLDTMDEPRRRAVLETLCAPERPERQWFNPNLSTARADRIVEARCGL